MLKRFVFVSFLLWTGCAAVGFEPLQTPPEFKQKVQLSVSDKYEMYQAPRSNYDLGDLQSFHTQHTFPIKVEAAFQEMFGQVEMLEAGPKIETGRPDVPAIFEVHIMDLSHDFFDENVDSFRAEITIGAAMKSPRGEIMWQQAFRGQGYVQVDQQFGHQIGPEQAVLDAVEDALGQMQDAIIKSPQVRLQMRHYQEIDAARSGPDKPLP